MCGRYCLADTPDRLREIFGYVERPNFPPRYNIAPTQPVAVVVRRAGRRSFALMRWGLIPAWAKDPRALPLLVNARAESSATRPAFRAAMRHRRCLVPADGFYEWQDRGRGGKVPHVVRRPDGGPFALAGLWETWTGPHGEEIDTVAILTTAANRRLAVLHPRMPVVVPPEAFDRWLDAEANPPKTVADLLAPAPDEHFEAVPVSTRINSVANDDPGLREPAAGAEAQEPSPAETPEPAEPAGEGRQMRLL